MQKTSANSCSISCFTFAFQYLTTYRNNDKMSDQTTGRQLQRILHYSVTPCRPLLGLRRSECALYDVDCDEVYPRLYIGDA